MAAVDWALTMSALALVQSTPGSLVSLGELMDRLRGRTDMTGPEGLAALESRIKDDRKDWLRHKMLLLNLIVAFSREHSVPDELVEYCNAELDRVRAEIEVLVATA